MHQLEFHKFSFDTPKEKIEKEMNEFAKRHSDSRTELVSYIQWYDNDIQNSEEEAQKFIEQHDSGFYHQLAVPFYNVKSEDLINKKTIDLRQKISTLGREYRQKDNHIHYANVKTKTVTCKHCESKLATAYLQSNTCPLCRTELRPDSVLKDLEKKAIKIETLRRQLKEEEQRLNTKNLKNAELMWFVKIEYHV